MPNVSSDQSSDSTSTSLLERVRSNDADAWCRLVRIYGPLVNVWLRRAGLQEADADDVFQDSFLTVSRSISRFRRDRPGDRFRHWLSTIVRTRIADHHRRKDLGLIGVGGSDALQEIEALPTAESNDAISADPGSVRLRALHSLRDEFDPRTWEMFWEAAAVGRATADVAAQFGVTPSAVRLAKSRILRRLRDELAGLGESEV